MIFQGQRQLHFIFMACAVVVISGCGSATSTSGSLLGDDDGDGDGDGDSQVEVDETRCIDDEGRDVCAAMKQDQVLIDVTADGSWVELYSDLARGTIMNQPGDCRGDDCGMLVQAGDEFRVVCHETSMTGAGTFGILLTEEFNLRGGGSVDYFATGMVDGENFSPMAFIGASGIENGDQVSQELDQLLTAHFDEMQPSSCDDTRVAVSSFGRELLNAD